MEVTVYGVGETAISLSKLVLSTSSFSPNSLSHPPLQLSHTLQSQKKAVEASKRHKTVKMHKRSTVLATQRLFLARLLCQTPIRQAGVGERFRTHMMSFVEGRLEQY